MSRYKCAMFISFVVVLEEEGVKHTPLIKGVKLIHLFSRFVSTHRVVEGKKCLKLLAVKKEHKETGAVVVTHVVLSICPQDCSLTHFLPWPKLGEKGGQLNIIYKYNRWHDEKAEAVSSEKYLKCLPAFQIFGPNIVISDSLIDHICSQAKFVKVEDNLQLFTLQPELRPLFFRIIINVLSELASGKWSHIILWI